MLNGVPHHCFIFQRDAFNFDQLSKIRRNPRFIKLGGTGKHPNGFQYHHNRQINTGVL